MANPFDELEVQLPGRLMTVEVLLTLLLREKSNARRLLVEAEKIIANYEAALIADGIGQENQYALKVFAVARASLDSIAARTRKE